MAAEHRADVLFALPALPKRVALVGDLENWRSDLLERRFEIVDRDADVVVATDATVREALSMRAPGGVVVDGTRASLDLLQRDGVDASQLVSLPLHGTPALFVDLAHRRAVRFAFARGLGHPGIFRTVRNLAVGSLVGTGFVPPFPTAVALTARGTPALLGAAEEFGVPRGAAWVMLVSPGSVVRRNAFLIFPPGAGSPTLALKFSRVQGLTEAFDREQAGFETLGRAGSVVRARAPEYLGRFAVDGFHASIETAAVGTRLSTVLRRPTTRAQKLRTVERVARWIIAVASATATRDGGALPAERQELESVVARRLPAAEAAALVAGLDDVPGSFQHNDLAEENIVIRGRDFRVVDWEWAELDGIPLGDLLFFAVHVLRLVDGVSDEERERYFVDVLVGRAKASPVLFEWVRTLATELALPQDTVARLATVAWLRRANRSAQERARAERTAGGRLQPAFAERAAEMWMSHPELGPHWRAWT